MRKNLAKTVFFFGIIFSLIYSSCSTSDGPSSMGPISGPMNDDEKNVGWEVGKTAPDFTLNTIDHDTISLSQYSGKIVFLYFFGNT